MIAKDKQKKAFENGLVALGIVQDYAPVICLIAIGTMLHEFLITIMGISKRDFKQHGKEIMEQLMGAFEYE